MNKGENYSREQRRSQIIYKGQCIDSNDPMRLGRIRAILRTENVDDREKANQNFGKQIYKEWDANDPFVFNPLLPFFINTPPKENEYVHLFYSNITRQGGRDKFYVSGVYSSPTTSNFEEYNSAITNLDEGTRNKQFANLLNEDNEYFYEDVKGIYAEPEDIGIYGRGTCDIIIKDDTVMLRAGKNRPFNSQQVPRRNEERAFLQLSKFDRRTVFGAPQKKLIFNFDHQNLKKLVEYNIVNPENSSNLFQGKIFIYNLAQKEGISVSTSNIGVRTEIPSTSKSLQTTVEFNNKSMTQVIKLVNDTLEGMVKGNIGQNINQDTENVTISGPQKIDVGNTFPFYFRPQEDLYKKASGVSPTTDMQTVYNLGQLFNGISITTVEVGKGYGLVFDKNKTDQVPFKPTKQNLIPKKVQDFDKSVGVMGGDELYLLSHKSQKLDVGKIDLKNTLYGIDENRFADEIEPKTSSLVRGEELIDLLDLIVRFMVNHVHPYHGMSPVPTSVDGVTVDTLLKELLDAKDKILNKNIRIN
jgi:hypothetical protein